MTIHSACMHGGIQTGSHTGSIESQQSVSVQAVHVHQQVQQVLLLGLKQLPAAGGGGGGRE